MELLFEARWRFLEGALNTIAIFLASSLVALILAFIVGLMRGSNSKGLKAFAIIFIEFFRGIPLLVQLFWLFFVLPFFEIHLQPITTAIIAFGLCNGAYGAVIVHAAIENVPRGQSEAAVSLNYRPGTRMWRILIPQAIPAMLPPFGNLAIELLKATALVSLITIKDLTFQAVTIQQTTMRVFEPFSIVLLGYFLIALCVTGLFRLLERRMNYGLERGGLR